MRIRRPINWEETMGSEMFHPRSYLGCLAAAPNHGQVAMAPTAGARDLAMTWRRHPGLRIGPHWTLGNKQWNLFCSYFLAIYVAIYGN